MLSGIKIPTPSNSNIGKFFSDKVNPFLQNLVNASKQYNPIQTAVNTALPITQIPQQFKNYVYNPETKQELPQSPIYDIGKIIQLSKQNKAQSPEMGNAMMSLLMKGPLYMGGVEPIGGQAAVMAAQNLAQTKTPQLPPSLVQKIQTKVPFSQLSSEEKAILQKTPIETINEISAGFAPGERVKADTAEFMKRKSNVPQGSLYDISMSNKAAKEYGITNVPESASFITQDGKIIDSSGKLQGSRMEGRNVDHREIAMSGIPDNATTNGMSGSDALSYFMQKSGSTRVNVMPDEISIDTLNPLSNSQISKLEQLSKGKTIQADISKPNGSVAKSGTFKTFSQYKNWLDKNIQSNVAQLPVSDKSVIPPQPPPIQPQSGKKTTNLLNPQSVVHPQPPTIISNLRSSLIKPAMAAENTPVTSQFPQQFDPDKIKKISDTFVNTLPVEKQEDANKSIPLIIKALQEEGILTPRILAYALASTDLETDHTWKPIDEHGDDTYFTRMYEGREDLKNTEPGDGVRFHGRGYLQLTGRDQHKVIGNHLGIDLVNHPELNYDPEISARVLAARFKVYGTDKIIEDKKDFENARSTINIYDYKTYKPLANEAEKILKVIDKAGNISNIQSSSEATSNESQVKENQINSKKFQQFSSGAIPPPMTPPIKAQGTQIVRADTGEPIKLKGVVSDAFRDIGVGDPLPFIQQAQKWGSNTVGLYVNPDVATQKIDMMDKTIEWAKNNGMYVYIIPVMSAKPTEIKSTHRDPNIPIFMSKIAERYKNNQNIMYGMGAEPHDITWEEWVDKASKTANLIRTINPNAPLIMTGINYGGDYTDIDKKQFPFDNVIYMGDNYGGENPEKLKSITKSDVLTRANFDNVMKKYPVLVGEFGGVWDTGFGTDEDINHIKLSLNELNKKGVSYTAYRIDPSDYEGGGLSLFDGKGNITRRGQIIMNDLYSNPATYIDNKSIASNIGNKLAPGENYKPVTLQGIDYILKLLGKK